MSLYRNISGFQKRVGYLYGNPMEDMERGDGGGGGGPLYPTDPISYHDPANPDGADVTILPNGPDPVRPILPIYPEEPVFTVPEPNVVNVTTPPQDVDYTGLITVLGLVATMVTGDGKGWGPWLFAGGCGVLYLELKKRNSQPVGIEPVRTS